MEIQLLTPILLLIFIFLAVVTALTIFFVNVRNWERESLFGKKKGLEGRVEMLEKELEDLKKQIEA